jgi:hypothetical protein
MKLPGRAWLEFEVVAYGNGSEIRQTVYPLHEILFRGMLRRIAKTATRQN